MTTCLDDLFAEFVRERTYLKGVSQKTIDHYKQAWASFRKSCTGETITRTELVDFVVYLKESGLRSVSINTYSRAINSFLNWLHERGAIEKLRIAKLKEDEKIIRPMSERELRSIITFKGKTFGERRLHALLCLLIDTGLRINEALTLERENLNFDDCLLTVKGKGNKERVVPFSFELRKVLYKFSLSHKFDLVFCTRHGGKIGYHNVRRDYVGLAKKLKLSTTSFHALRHNYGLSHIKSGGDVFSLQRILGHSDLSTTKRYVNFQTEDLSNIHKRTSILSRLR